MKRYVITCDDDSKFECEIGDRERLEITKGGKVRLVTPGCDPVTSRLPSPAVRVDELVEVRP